MFRKVRWVLVVVILAAVIAACGGAGEEGGGEAVEAPAQLRLAIITCCGIESMWDASFFQSLERVKEEAPHGLTITWDWTDGVWGDDAERVMREYAQTGEYDIIWATSSYSDQAANLREEFPETMFVYHGSGNTGLGGNAYWLYMRVHEASYLLGRLAGQLTETDRVGSVGTFAYDDVNDELNAFFQGARDVNPDVQVTVSFIESWYDPVLGSGGHQRAGRGRRRLDAPAWGRVGGVRLQRYHVLRQLRRPELPGAGERPRQHNGTLGSGHPVADRRVVGARGRRTALEWQHRAEVVLDGRGWV